MANETKIIHTINWGIWLGGPLALVALDMVLRSSDTRTEITPSHHDVLNVCSALGGLGALGLASVAIFSRQSMRVWQRVFLAMSLALVGFLSVFMLSSRIATLAENHLDFPATRTRTFTGHLLISRAYRIQGKGQSCNIQTMPIWSNLNITPGDYQFMLDHRLPRDLGRNPDEISSRGYFCARVTMQQSGSALRVLNAGDHALPSGTVVICPAKGGFAGH